MLNNTYKAIPKMGLLFSIPLFCIKKASIFRYLLFWRRRRDFSLREPVGTSVHTSHFLCSYSLCSCHSFLLLSSSSGRSRKRPPRASALGFNFLFLYQKSKYLSILAFLAEKEGFEPSRRFPDLHP